MFSKCNLNEAPLEYPEDLRYLTPWEKLALSAFVLSVMMIFTNNDHNTNVSKTAKMNSHAVLRFKNHTDIKDCIEKKKFKVPYDFTKDILIIENENLKGAK